MVEESYLLSLAETLQDGSGDAGANHGPARGGGE